MKWAPRLHPSLSATKFRRSGCRRIFAETHFSYFLSSLPALSSFEAAARKADTKARRALERFPPMPLSTMTKPQKIEKRWIPRFRPEVLLFVLKKRSKVRTIAAMMLRPSIAFQIDPGRGLACPDRLPSHLSPWNGP